MKFKKGSKEAKAYMAKLRAARGKKTTAKKTAAKKVGNTLKFEDGYFKVLGKKNNQLVEITENPLNYIDAKKFIKEQGIEKYYTNVDIVPYRGNKKPVKYIGSTLKLNKKETRLGIAPKTKAIKRTPKKVAAKKSSSYHKDTKSHNVNIRVMSGLGSIDTLHKEIKQTQDYLIGLERAIESNNKYLKIAPSTYEKNKIKKDTAFFKSKLAYYKKALIQLKKLYNKK